MDSVQTRSPWFPYNQAPRQATARLFCFPYGGGSAAAYRDWQTHLPQGLEVYPIQLPGRGMRLHEDAITELPVLVKVLANELSPYLHQPYYFFGHSMGALLSYEVTRNLAKKGKPLPKHLFVSGYHAPQLPGPNPPIHHLPDNDFINKLAKMNGTPSELLANREFLDLFLPSLRADFKMCETYSYIEGPELTCPITVFGGKHDPEASEEMLAAWEMQTSGGFAMQMFEGDHFYLHHHEQMLVERIMQGMLEAQK